VEWVYGRLLQHRWAPASRIPDQRRRISVRHGQISLWFYSMLYMLVIFVTNTYDFYSESTY
jgi:hypothetical protein